MATLDQTLQVFRALLEADPPVAIGEADEAIWAYLVPIQGLSAQAEALEVLRYKAAELDGTSAFMPRLMEDLDRHKERLSERAV
ncbi:hypothetical protein MKK75_14710 [Methylobacterium sp. J-030]|uniref:hypothetical protein n=1 Tax=Methylobacterium sp. J-030 TaxID=2836627 RepID=UPI001FBC13DE|nr:hypothetical protein [Methylobacterium sp. J-030]MCJ2070030.1 hypothetical protein [Methylobacterium sp. J-030]